MAQHVFCTNCGKQIAAGQPFCPHCGIPVEELQAPDPKRTVRLNPDAAPSVVQLQHAAVAPSIGGAAVPHAVGTNGTAGHALPPTGAPTAPSAMSTKFSQLSGAVLRRIPSIKRAHLMRLVPAVAALALLFVAGSWAWGRFGGGTAPGVHKTIVTSDEGDGLQSLYVMGTSSNDKVLLATADVPPSYGGWGSISRVDLPESPMSTIRSYANAHFLPDQQRIIYTYFLEESGWELESTNLEGQDRVSLLGGVPNLNVQVSDANGMMVFFESDNEGRQSLSMGGLTGSPHVLVDDADYVSGMLSPDGRYVVYWHQSEDDGYTTVLADSTGTTLAELAKDTDVVQGLWSQDSSKFFLSTGDQESTRTYMFDANGQNKQEIARRGQITKVRVVDGQVLYQLMQGDKQTLFAQDLNSGEKRDVIRGSSQLNWELLPDEQTLVVSEAQGQRGSLRLEPLEGGDAVELEDGIEYATWTLDGGRLVYQFRRNGSWSVASVNQDGEDKQEIVRGWDSVNGVVGRNGTVVVSGEDAGDALLQYWNGEKLISLADDADSYYSPNFTPDGRAVTYMDAFGEGPGNTSLYRVGLDGKKREQIMDAARIEQQGW